MVDDLKISSEKYSLVHLVAHNNLSEIDHVMVPRLHQCLNLPQPSDWEPVRRVLKLELLQCDNFSCGDIFRA